MRTLGLVGGTSWHATVAHYSTINRLVNERYGDNTNPPLRLYNMNQAQIHALQRADDWVRVAELFAEASRVLASAGAEAVVFCANTPHKIYDIVQDQLSVPILHIADATALAIRERGLRCVSFIGTKFSMTEEFIARRLASHGIEVFWPEKTEAINELHRIIQKELTYDRVEPASKQFVLDELNSLIDQGAEGVVLGCTEFPLLINQEDFDVPVFDTAEIHARAAVDFVLNTREH